MLNYTDSDFLKPVFSCLVIKVSSIVKHFESLDNFTTTYDYYGETNGVLLISAEMCTPAFRLEAFAEETLVPNGLKVKEDFFFMDEILTEGVQGHKDENLYKEHPDCKNVNWLKSMIFQTGNYIWYSDPNLTELEKDTNVRLIRKIGDRDSKIFDLNPRIFKIDNTYVHYTMSDSDIHYKFRREDLRYNEEKYVF